MASQTHPVSPSTCTQSVEECEIKSAGGLSDESVEGEGEQGEDEEARTPKILADAGTPSKREVEEHVVAHWPYRSWCPHCVRGRGRRAPHRARGESERQIPVASADYCFIDRDTDDGDAETPVLVTSDSATGTVFANMCRGRARTPR